MVSRIPRPETSWPVASVRVPGGTRTGGAAAAVATNNRPASHKTRIQKTVACAPEVSLMRIAMSLLVASLALSAACKKKEATDTSASQGSAQAMGSGSPMGSAGSGSADMGSAGSAGSAATDTGSAGSAAGSDQMARRGGNCPSTVFGSTTTAELKDGKIALTITSADKDAIAAIQRRTEELLKEKTKPGGGQGTAHDAKGTHGGSMGLCPVHLGEGGTATSKPDPKGVVITITPKDKADGLKAEIDARITKAAEWVKANLKEGDQGTTGGVGGGAGEHGSNHSGDGDSKGKDRKGGDGKGGDGKGGGKGTGGGGGAGTGGGNESAGSATK